MAASAPDQIIGRPPYSIVVELLRRENYPDWSTWVKNYLLGQDLWEVVEEAPPPPPPPPPNQNEQQTDQFKAWRRKNAAALHAIHMSCGPEPYSLIRGITSAKMAWEKLAITYSPPPPPMDNPVADINGTGTQPGNANLHQRFAALYGIVKSGNWNSTKEYLEAYPEAKTAKLAFSGKTALHTAAVCGHTQIVEELVKLLEPIDLEIRDMDGYTPLAAATCTGVTRMAECMVQKNSRILKIKNQFGVLPVQLALNYGHSQMARYLYSVTPLEELMPENGNDGATLFNQSFYSHNFDIALDLLRQCPRLVISPDREGFTPVFALANMPSVFPSGGQLAFWQQWIYNCIHIPSIDPANILVINIQNDNQSGSNEGKLAGRNPLHRLASFLVDPLGIKKIYEMKFVHTQTLQLLRGVCKEVATLDVKQLADAQVYISMFRAAERGNKDFITEISKLNPDLLWSRDAIFRNIFFTAIQFRQAKVFSLLYGLVLKEAAATSTDTYFNNMLHVAGMSAPSSALQRISGAALQMQREIQWFKEVESLVPPVIRESRNKDGMTPQELFTASHKELVKEGEKWMKETATSCSVVGVLIVTIMFAAAFTVPGGNVQETGYPIFLNKKLFMLFIISDAISLFSSTTSVLMFLGILTSRYAEEDFLTSLPRKLIIGLSTLFISMAAMLISFCSALVIMLQERTWISIPIITLASLPVTLFVLLQFRLLVEIFVSTYGSGIFERKK